MRLTTKTLSTAAIFCLLVGAGSAAYAGTVNEGPDATVPNLQQPWNSAAQAKAITGAGGGVHLDTVGSEYTLDARICNQGNGTCGTERYDLGDGSYAPLDAPFAAGASVHLQLHTYGFSPVRVEGIGRWHSS